MLNPLAYKLVWLAVTFSVALGAVLPLLFGLTELAIVTMPVGAVLLFACIGRMYKKRRIRLPKRKKLH